MVKLFEGLYENKQVTVLLDGDRVVLVDDVTGEATVWNDEPYTEDDWSLIKDSLCREGFRF